MALTVVGTVTGWQMARDGTGENGKDVQWPGGLTGQVPPGSPRSGGGTALSWGGHKALPCWGHGHRGPRRRQCGHEGFGCCGESVLTTACWLRLSGPVTSEPRRSSGQRRRAGQLPRPGRHGPGATGGQRAGADLGTVGELPDTRMGQALPCAAPGHEGRSWGRCRPGESCRRAGLVPTGPQGTSGR